MGINNFLAKLFGGNKAERDRKEVVPHVEKIKAAYTSIETLTDDGLREKSNQLKEKVRGYVSAEREKIAELRASV